MGNFPGDATVPNQPACVPAAIHHYFSAESWIEGAALDQLEKMSRLPGVRSIAAFPDLHPGKYGPTGVALLSDRLHPLLVGNDIGCGMSMFELDLPLRKLKLDKAASRLRRFDTLAIDAASSMAAEYGGTVKFLFKSPVRPGHKRQNWFVSVQRIEVGGGEEVEIDPRDIRFETLRAGGPGGQHQNTTDSAVRAIHIPTGLRVTARNERSQHRNKALAIRRLSSMLQHLEDRKTDTAKSERFIANRSIERGNEVKTFKL